MSLNEITDFSIMMNLKITQKIFLGIIFYLRMISPQVWHSIFFAKVNILLDEHAPNHKLSKREISLKAKSWINKNIQALMRERDRLFKRYCNENSPTLKAAKHNKYKNAWNVIILKVKKSKKEYYQNYFQKHSKIVKGRETNKQS